MILQNKTGQRNSTANDFEGGKWPHRLHTYYKKVTTIEILVRPGPDVPYVLFIFNMQNNHSSFSNYIKLQSEDHLYFRMLRKTRTASFLLIWYVLNNRYIE